ncbi:unnamed protein product, partial [marine sediment metagenome]
ASIAPSAYFMKSPPVQYTDNEARQMVEEFIAELPKSEPAEKSGQGEV